MHARLGVTYESAQTRRFKNGRTEVVRSLSSEAAEWVKAMINPSAHKVYLESTHTHHLLTSSQDPTHLRSLFLAAVKRHMTYSSWAANGQGIDRHLFGLKKSLKSDEEVPGLYKDEAYAKSSHWEMSTSQLSSPLFDGWGYGEGVYIAPFLVFATNALGSCGEWVWPCIRSRLELHALDRHEPQEHAPRRDGALPRRGRNGGAGYDGGCERGGLFAEGKGGGETLTNY